MVGGSAGSKLDFKNTYIYAQGKVMENHGVLTFCKLKPDALRRVEEPELPRWRQVFRDR